MKEGASDALNVVAGHEGKAPVRGVRSRERSHRDQFTSP